MRAAVNIDGVMHSPETARVSVFDHGFLYGDSVYETIRVYRGRPLLLDRHLQRLALSAAAIGLEIPCGNDELRGRVAQTVAAVGVDQVALRIAVSRGEGELGIDPRLCPRATVVMIARSFQESPDRGVHVVVADTVRNSKRALDPAIKSGNFLNNIQAYREAIASNAFEALMLNHEGELAEATQSNVFLVADGVLVTPAGGCGILLGITREMVIGLARRNGIEVEERSVDPSELYSASEVFLTSTLKGALPVLRVDETVIGTGEPGPITRLVRSLYEEATQEL